MTRKEANVQTVTGIFLSETDAHEAVDALVAKGVPAERISLLTPGQKGKNLEAVRVDAAEKPGIGKAIGGVLGAAGGLSGGSILFAMIPGVGPVTAVGLLGAAILGAAGASVGVAAGASLENFTTEGLPEDEIFVYEDALRRGRSVVIASAEDSAHAEPLREELKARGAEAIDAARQQWWIGLRSAEQEHFSASGKNFEDAEKFYRLGFEDALHARTRCKEFDQVSAEMESNLEELQRRYPGQDVADAYSEGFQRGREYYQNICDGSKAA